MDLKGANRFFRGVFEMEKEICEIFNGNISL